MKYRFGHNKQALVQSLVTFGGLFSAVILMVLYYDFTHIDLGKLLFLVAFLCCVFIAKNVYDVTEIDAKTARFSGKDNFGVSTHELSIQLYQKSPVPYMIIDQEGIVSSANMAAARILGLPQSSVSGVNIFSLLASDEEDHLDFLVEKYQRSIPVSDEMVMVKRTDKVETWALLSLVSFVDAYGDSVGLLTLVDITKQKKAENAKSEFVSLASHQLRTPIAGMKWSVELLQLDGPDRLSERQHKYIDRLLISIKRMSILVDDFLRVSRFELGTFKPEYTEVNMREIFEDIISEQAARIEQKNLHVKTFYDQSIETVIIDGNLLRMIVANLYSNATKYTQPTGTIHIGFGKKDETIVVTVADNGMGIPEKDQDEVFSKLFRAANAVRNVPDGTGLGLYIARQAVAVLKGNITFTSAENMGTTFEVVLPLELPTEKVT